MKVFQSLLSEQIRSRVSLERWSELQGERLGPLSTKTGERPGWKKQAWELEDGVLWAFSRLG